MIKYKKGQSVRVAADMKDYETEQIDISGWEGRIVDIYQEDEGVFVEVQWDSITLKLLPEQYIEDSIEEELEYENYILDQDDVEVCQPRDSEADVHRAQDELTNQYFDLEEDSE